MNTFKLINWILYFIKLIMWEERTEYLYLL